MEHYRRKCEELQSQVNKLSHLQEQVRCEVLYTALGGWWLGGGGGGWWVMLVEWIEIWKTDIDR